MASHEGEDSVRSFADQVLDEFGEERMYACFECGHCASCCPVVRVNSHFSPRKIIHMILLGMTEEVVQSNILWLCSTCYTCQEICPQGIKIADLITTVRNLAFRKGYAPPGVFKQVERISTHGRLYALDEFDEKKRRKANLPALARTIDEAIRLLEDKK